MKALEHQIAGLEAQRRSELRHSSYLYARTKRDMRRTFSLQRQVRRHLPLALLTALVVGFALAPGRKKKSPPPPASSPSRWLGLISRLTNRFFPALRGAMPDGHPGTFFQGLLRQWLRDTLHQRLSQFDWKSFLKPKDAPPAGGPEFHPPHPDQRYTVG